MRNFREERLAMQQAGLMPADWPTAAWQMFSQNYLYEAATPKEQYERIARTAAKQFEDAGVYPSWWEKEFGGKTWSEVFFDLLHNAHIIGSTPVIANAGTNRGAPVSCSGGVVPNNIHGIYDAIKEVAVLSKHGFGTSVYMGEVCPRGTPFKGGGRASGTVPFMQAVVQAARDVRQGSARRGAVAVYLEANHADFWEWIHLLDETPDDYNIGWLLTDDFITDVLAGKDEAKKRWVEIIRVKLITGRGYLVKIDEINRRRPETYKANNLDVKASNLCSEITLHSSEEYSFSCILSNMNLAKYRELHDKTPFLLICFLDGICQSFLEYSKGVPGLEKVRNFTVKGRALGAGVCGFHTLLQKEGIAWEDLQATFLNGKIFRWYQEGAEEATKWMASALGEPEWCKGFGRRNTHLMSMPPTKSTALLAGGVSEGINPDPKMVYLASTAAGEIPRFNPVLLEIAKQRLPDADLQAITEAIDKNAGSVQDVDWLTDEEKRVFKTAFEIPLSAQIRHAEQRQRFVDQSQSTNLFIAGDTDMAHLAETLKQFLTGGLLTLYYFYSERDAKASNGECVACQ